MRSIWTAIGSLSLVVVALGVDAGCSSDSSTGSSDAGAGTTTDAGNDGGGATADAASDATATSDAAAEAGESKKFGEPCASDAECASHACFMGGSQAYCSFHCTPQGAPSTDCPTPPTSGQCNNQGYCKK